MRGSSAARATIVLLVSALMSCSTPAAPPPGGNPALHPSLDDALANGFAPLVGRAPFATELWLEDAVGWDIRWETAGAEATGGGMRMALRFTRPGVYQPSATLSARGRETVTLTRRIVVIADAPPPLPSGKFGVNQDLPADPPQQVASEIRLMRAAGVGWLRLPLRWFWNEPRRGQVRWDYFDGVVQQAGDAGLELLAVLGGTPRWASGVDNTTAPRTVERDAFPPTRTSDFAAYVYRMVDRYRGRVRAYEMLNEPNSPDHWAPAPNAERFVELLCAGYLAAKYADPDATVVVGGLNGNGLALGYEAPVSRDFLKAIYAGEGARCFDVMAIHPFAHPTEDGIATLQSWVDATRAYMSSMSDTRPLWLTEVGWSSGQNLWGHTTITEDEQAKWVREVYSVGGVQKLFWYNFKETRADPNDPELQWGWLRYDLQPKPAYRAFAALPK